MRRLFAVSAVLLLTCLLSAQSPSTPDSSQTARQALIEMFFGSAANHLEKHLPDATRKALHRMGAASGQDALAEFSMLSMQAKAMGAGLQTFDTGPTLLTAEDPRTGDAQRVEITVERDDLVGDEDQIELALHMTRNGKEDTTLPFIPRFTFIMKTESEVWRLNEISVTVRVPIGDPDFLKRIEDRGRAENEQSVQWSLRTITSGETSYHAANGSYACSLAELYRANTQSSAGGTVTGNVIADDLAKGKRGGYIFAISGCDASGYKLVAEPAGPDSGQRAFCSDESGQFRASADGKATTCLSSGEKVEGGPGAVTGGVIASGPVLSAPAQNNTAQRIRVSEGVTKGLVTSRVQPVYPADAAAAKVRGQVVLGATISGTGDVVKLHVISGSPLLTAAAINAAKQWKYRPYVLNGKPIEVETQITIDFSPDHN